MQNQPGNKTLL